jgi:NAD(P)-dependent dehydrogenase (short-subunit alcohol dehydrogenase family)
VTLLGQVVASHPADVSHSSACTAIAVPARQVPRGLTILVNNARVYGSMGRGEDNDWDEWVRAVQVNLLGAVLMCRAILASLRAQRYGKISGRDRCHPDHCARNLGEAVAWIFRSTNGDMA